MNPLPLLLAESTRSDLRWHHAPPAWVLALVIAPLVVAAAWWAYRRESEVPRPARFLLGTLRAAAIALFLVVLLGPYAEVSEVRTVRANLIVLVDRSQSMGTIDAYDPEDARRLATAAGLPASRVTQTSRLDLALAVLRNREPDLLSAWTEDYRLHVFSFGAQTTPVVGAADAETPENPGEESAAEAARRRLGDIQATDPATRIGQAVTTVLDTFRVRDEPIAGVVVVSDGQDNGTVVRMAQAGRKAAAMHVPIFSVGVGDPRSPRNIHVSNLRCMEVVLVKDDTVIEFTVHAKGFRDRRARIELFLRPSGTDRLIPVAADPPEVVLEGGDEDQQVKVTHRFLEPGLVTIRVGIPVQPEEKIQSDNYVEHTLRVIDRKIKVLFVDGVPRWEFHFLANALTRDTETMLARTILFDADPDTPQKRTQSPDWKPEDETQLALPSREQLFKYDVVILGDVDWKQFAPTEAGAKEALQNLRDFVDRGGGLLFVSGVQNNPARYKNTELQALLPVILDRAAEDADPRIDTTAGFHLRLTPEGEEAPLMDVAGDPRLSKRLWEEDRHFRQFWSYPALRAKTLARVLAVSGHEAHQDPRQGPRPVIATMLYGRGRVLWVGVDELWRTRREVADHYFYRFYGAAVRFLATYRLLGGNKRFKILTDRDRYGVDDPVRITLDVLDRDYEPSKDPEQSITVQVPAGAGAPAESLVLAVAADPVKPGTYRRTLLPTRPGEYRIQAASDDPEDPSPEKIFRVVESTLEGRELLLDEARLTEMASLSEGGRYLHVADLPSLRPPTRSVEVPTDKHDDEMWDDLWVLVLATSLLAAEWLLRKRWHLV